MHSESIACIIIAPYLSGIYTISSLLLDVTLKSSMVIKYNHEIYKGCGRALRSLGHLPTSWGNLDYLLDEVIIVTSDEGRVIMGINIIYLALLLCPVRHSLFLEKHETNQPAFLSGSSL